ncbi:MAG: hypothetical protein H0X30_00265 [Anaerolineae bacterium]|nr:hypothetical protein [Anaerolineae bacterium]
MNEIKRLLNDYLNGLIPSKDFVTQFLALAGRFRDEALDLLSKNPELSTKLEKLFAKHVEGTISESEYQEQWQNLIVQTKQGAEISIKPYSLEEEIISHLFVEADAYREDPKDRRKGLNIGDDELRTEVERTLEALNKSS